MIYLLAKYTLLFILTALSGFILGRWVTRRSFVDVSESYADMRDAATRSEDSADWKRLWDRLDALPGHGDINLASVNERLDGLSYAIGNLPVPTPVDLTSVESKITALSERLRKIPYPITLKAADLDPIVTKLEDLEGKIGAIPTPEITPAAILTPLTARLDGIEQSIRKIPTPPPQHSIDLTPVRAELASIRQAINRLPIVETHEAVDIEPIRLQMGSLERRVHELPRPKPVDLSPVDKRLGNIETELLTLSRRLAKPTEIDTAPAKIKRQEPVILSAALCGEKDDLRLISGIGPKLERTLNQNGVYYFWQVATWQEKDIALMDEQLDTFSGRIERDQWVAQANQLSLEASSAKRPADISQKSE